MKIYVVCWKHENTSSGAQNIESDALNHSRIKYKALGYAEEIFFVCSYTSKALFSALAVCVRTSHASVASQTFITG